MLTAFSNYTARLGKKLKALHAWNVWVIAYLAVSGILLYLPQLRGATASVRTILKTSHIAAGLMSITLLLLYIPLLRKHAARLRGRTAQLSNLAVVLFLLVGWSVTGIILSFETSAAAAWTSAALIGHDLITWVGIPYAIYHSVSRSRWVKQADRSFAVRGRRDDEPDRAATAADVGHSAPEAKALEPALRFKCKPISRRTFLRFGTGTLLVAVLGPPFYRWLKAMTDNGGLTLAGHAPATDPSVAHYLEATSNVQPLPDSRPPIGGGAQGAFRAYTVTEFPNFHPEEWSFTVSGLVDRPLVYSWDEFAELQRKVQVSDFHCITGWSVYQCTWEGIPLSWFLKEAGAKPEGKFVKLYSGDGVYTSALSMKQALMEDAMVTALIDGTIIPEKLGGPVRLIVPQMYAYKSVKWLQAVEIVDEPHIGYWEARGYENDAWIPGAVKV